MKTQFLMIIAVVLSSLMTISQHASAQEVSQLHWLEPVVEKLLDKVVADDQDEDLDNNDLAFNVFIREVSSTSSPHIFVGYTVPAHNKTYQSISPRAPPFSLI
ncbi:hypothetical protein OFY17_09710 [Marinomonas sp. C2222]|uniref:Uncharacterized protein n=1 Tax=Marinomonas sargassi TaxID=2984494 RepID=A0ABT2YTD0_9GAMM|nr:hypothetical protein [Marinomonas sargassi]MCV2403152.1 hypothetical protein [Marinomonas sargassi]